MRITKSTIPYLKHGLNFSKYCNQCTFCYMNRWRESDNPEPTEDFEFRINHEMGELARQLKRGFKAKGDIMMSTSHDPFAPHCFRTGIMALKVLRSFRSVTAHLRILSKRLSEVVPAAIAGMIPSNARYGATITTLADVQHKSYCPGADPTMKQVQALQKLNALRYHTWLSLEPCFSYMRISRMIGMVPFVGEVIIGKLNRVATDKRDYEVLSKEEFKQQIAQAHRQYPDIRINLKPDLAKWLDKTKRGRQ